MNRLRLRLHLLSVEGDQLFSPDWEPWGRVHLVLRPGDGSPPWTLQWGEWRLDGLLEWIVKNGRALCSEPLDIEGRRPLPHESLSQAHNRILNENLPADDSEDPLTEEQLRVDALIDGYFRRHQVAAELRGDWKRPVLVGCNQGQGEVSLNWNEAETWAYAIDLDDFLADLWRETRRFLEEWEVLTQQDWARTFARDLLNRLGDPPQGCCRL